MAWKPPRHLFAAPRTAICSIIASFSNFAILTVLVQWLDVWYVPANALGAVVGAIINFTLNKHWTFQVKHGQYSMQFGRYALVSATSLALNSLFIYGLTDGLGLPYQISWAGSTLVVAWAWNYVAYRSFIFSKPDQGMDVAPLPLWAQRLAKAIATVGGLGLSPLMPGTLGAIAALPFIWFMAHQALWLQVAATGAVIGIGVVASQIAGDLWGTDDDQRIIIDETAGMMVTMLALPPDLMMLALGFGLFRLADILKPFPANWADRNIKGGVGVMVDDVIAGLWGLVILHALRSLAGII